MVQALVDALSTRVQLVGGLHGPWFTANGMRVSREGRAFRGFGIFEVSSAECTTAEDLALHLVAIDALLIELLPLATDALASRGFQGRLGLLKHSRDPHGEVYGRQDNIQIARPGGLRCLVHGTVLLVWSAVHIITIVAMLAAILGSVVVCMSLAACTLWPVALVAWWIYGAEPSTRHDLPGTTPSIPSAPSTEMPVTAPTPAFLEEPPDAASASRLHRNSTWIGRLLAKTTYSNHGPMDAYLMSRPMLFGAGHVSLDGTFQLAAKLAATPSWWPPLRVPAGERVRGGVLLAHHMRRDFWNRLVPDGHRALRHAVGPTARMQLGGADSNRAPFAEALSVVSLRRVVDLVERGELEDAPRFKDPLQAAKLLAADETLATTVVDVNGVPWTAPLLQGFYQKRARVAFPDDPWVEAWGDAIEGVQHEPNAWVGRIDWITKRYLLDQVAAGATLEVRQRVDIEYHDLGVGLYDRLLGALDLEPLWDPEQVEQAKWMPPHGRARERAMLIATHGDSLSSVGWDRVNVGGKVVWLHSRLNP